MFDIHSIVRFLSILFYLGMITSSITGFVSADDISTNEYRVCLITTSLILFLQNIIYITYEMLRLYDKYQIVMENLFYFRSILIIQSAILSMGLSNVGLGFGIFGVVMFFVNVLAGVFVEPSFKKVSPFYGEEQNIGTER